MLNPVIIENSSVINFLNSFGFGYLSLFIFPCILFPSDEDLTRIFKKRLGGAPDLIIFKKTAIEKHTIRFQQNLELFYIGYVFLFLLEFVTKSAHIIWGSGLPLLFISKWSTFNTIYDHLVVIW